ncbi:orotidine 5'-phosphate decarboxylase / HUMPS family protein [Streptomyces sp. NBC_00239]|uniref:orotidine 5'-phosphate decarboxylase / HUMPS family protein n=1 Tax=Streptomyces sp. NBC_00239 TaxID=2903640 RepID=UPI002E2ABC7B|nr:orotidine 5'-phosphate decarboxylase / HUMPS family protein [Streptomyces sp. NBC_00239]
MRPWPTSRIIVALDSDDCREAVEVVDRLGEECRFYKVGTELLTAAGPDLIEHLAAKGKEVFLDLKLFTSRWRASRRASGDRGAVGGSAGSHVCRPVSTDSRCQQTGPNLLRMDGNWTMDPTPTGQVTT